MMWSFSWVWAVTSKEMMMMCFTTTLPGLVRKATIQLQIPFSQEITPAPGERGRFVHPNTLSPLTGSPALTSDAGPGCPCSPECCCRPCSSGREEVSRGNVRVPFPSPSSWTSLGAPQIHPREDHAGRPSPLAAPMECIWMHNQAHRDPR